MLELEGFNCQSLGQIPRMIPDCAWQDDAELVQLRDDNSREEVQQLQVGFRVGTV